MPCDGATGSVTIAVAFTVVAIADAFTAAVVIAAAVTIVSAVAAAVGGAPRLSYDATDRHVQHRYQRDGLQRDPANRGEIGRGGRRMVVAVICCSCV